MLKLYVILSFLFTLGLTLEHDLLIPENENITKLDWSNKGLTSVKEYDFSKFTLLNEIDLSNNQIQIIGTDIFQKNNNIEKIDLSGNTNLRLPEYATLLSCPAKELNISNCNIKKTYLSTFDGLRYLKTLDLSNNPIKKKGLHIKGLSTIEKLEKLILPPVDKYTLRRLCTEFTYTIIIKDKNQNINTLDCTKYKKIDSDEEEDDVNEKEKQAFSNEEIDAKSNEEEVQKPPIVSSLSVDGFVKQEVPDQNSPADLAKQNKPNEEVENSKKKADGEITNGGGNDAVEKAPENHDEKPHLEPRIDGESLITETNKTEGVGSSINVPILPGDIQEKSPHIEDEKPNREPREDGRSDSVDTSQDNALNKPDREPRVGESPDNAEIKPDKEPRNGELPDNAENKPNEEPRVGESPDNAENNPNKEPRLGEHLQDHNVKVEDSVNVPGVLEVVITGKPRTYHAVVENPSDVSEEAEKLHLKNDIGIEASDGNATISKPVAEDNNMQVKSPQLLSENDKSPSKEVKVELKETDNVSSNLSQANLSEKMQAHPDANDKETVRAAEVTESSNTGSTILIVLVIAVVVAGVAAFGYKFYKNRTYQESEPVERELKEIVSTKPLNEDAVRDVTEQEPLMNNHVNKENGNSKPNPIASNNFSTGPYQPTTTTFKPIDQTDDK